MLQENKSYWSQIHNTYTRYTDEIHPEEGDLLAVTAIDAWKTADPEEPGKVIASVLLSCKGDIIISYQDQIARNDVLAQDKIQEAISHLQELYQLRIAENRVAPSQLIPAVDHVTLKLSPEVLSLWNNCLGKTYDELCSLFGAITDNPELQFDFGNNFTGHITLWIPEDSQHKTRLLLDLFHGSLPAAKGILLSDHTALTGDYFIDTDKYGPLKMTVMEAPEKRRIGNSFIFKTSATSPDLSIYNNKPCHVLSTLEPLLEYEPLAIGELMYNVRFADGTERQVYDSELSHEPIPEIDTKLDTLISNAKDRCTDSSLQSAQYKKRKLSSLSPTNEPEKT